MARGVLLGCRRQMNDFSGRDGFAYRVIEGDAVVERGVIDGLALAQLHDPDMAVLIRLAITGDPRPSQSAITVSPSA